jgi:hypothetical protein
VLLLDANIVLAAHRADHPQHAPIRAWFEDMLRGQERFGVPDSVWTTFLRVATNRRIFEVPTPRADAFTFIESICAQPLFLALTSGPRHLALLRELCDEGDAMGDLVPDAVIAALAAEHSCTIVSLDRDFARFDSVAHVRPPSR